MEDPLDRALAEIASLATNMNEGKRESESRSKLVKWQARIKGSSKFPSPLVQPHRRLIMDGKLTLTRVVRKTVANFEVLNANGDPSLVQVECLAPEMTPRALIGVLCNDLLVLCRDVSDGRDPAGQVELWAVLRMQTVPQPASIVHDNVLRIVDNKAVLYFTTPTASEALNWYRGWYCFTMSHSVLVADDGAQRSTSISLHPRHRVRYSISACDGSPTFSRLLSPSFHLPSGPALPSHALVSRSGSRYSVFFTFLSSLPLSPIMPM
jgi:hypothetical protein